MNAFPTIMNQIFNQAGIDTPFLNDYVSKREELFQVRTPFLDRAMLKRLFLTSLHLGNYRHLARCQVPFLDLFQREVKLSMQQLLNDQRFKAMTKGKKNPSFPTTTVCFCRGGNNTLDSA